MSEQAHAAIDSLTASVASLQGQVRAIVNHIEGKAAATASSALTSSVTLAERTERLRKYTSANGAVVIDSTSGVITISTPMGKVTLGDLEKAEQRDLCIDPGQAIQPLRMGKVTFYGESARQIRAAQEVLHAAGVGQLEVVKRANEPGEPFVVIDGQVFIAKSNVESFAVDPDKFKVRVEINEKGQFYAAGIGLGVVDGGYGKALEAGGVMEYISGLISESALGSSLHEQVIQVIRDELKPGGMLHQSNTHHSS